MSTLFWGARGAVPADEAEVRSTVTVVDNDAPSAMQEHAPDFNETLTDPDTEGGLTSRQLASHVTPSERYAPQPVSAVDPAIINDQVSSSGTAAAREASGNWGHGTMLVVDGIEPAIRDGQAFGDLYFKADERGANADQIAYMTPAQTADNPTLNGIVAQGKDDSRKAASPYDAFVSFTTGKD